MRALLDTHVFLWWITDRPELPGRVRELIRSSRNELLFSAASGWEIAIKTRLGRLHLPAQPEPFILTQLALNAMDSLPITMRHALHVHTLPSLHRDPFDRMLVSQAQLERLPIITADSLITQYRVETIW
jgi:PIN domain nuclease of toxin-antitoxin system